MVYEPETQQWDGKGSLLEYVKDKNLNRRQLSESQKGMIAARMKPLYEKEAAKRRMMNSPFVSSSSKEPAESFEQVGKTNEIVGAMVGVSRGTVYRASKVLDAGIPELISSVDEGGLKVRTAAEIAKLPKSEQPIALAEYRDKKANAESKPKEHKTSRNDPAFAGVAPQGKEGYNGLKRGGGYRADRVSCLPVFDCAI